MCEILPVAEDISNMAESTLVTVDWPELCQVGWLYLIVRRLITYWLLFWDRWSWRYQALAVVVVTGAGVPRIIFPYKYAWHRHIWKDKHLI